MGHIPMPLTQLCNNYYGLQVFSSLTVLLYVNFFKFSEWYS